ncbi:MAG: DUF4338 domain-containing protein, partial [Synergistota bacterium]|nr:DUF4338 domain-containing protein [Synergistota bacterium]
MTVLCINPSVAHGSKNFRYCGRTFSVEEMDGIRSLIAAKPRRNRHQLSRVVCEQINWRRPDGRVKDMSCRVAMLRMHRDGLIRLPPPERGNGNGRTRPKITAVSDPQPPLRASVDKLGEITLRMVDTRKESSLWNELIQRYHYLGYTPLPGAQLRYLIYSNSTPACASPDCERSRSGRYADRLLAALGFGAAAWKVAPRDNFIGWSSEQRKNNLQLVVNNARFLILPWITVKNLASKTLAAASKRLPSDWMQRYGYQPVLLETFVECARFHGTCYRAANWTHVGKTK